MRYEFHIALRYLISKQSTREPTVIGMLTVAGLALSTGIMIIVLSVFAGFEGDLREKILGTHAHVLVSGPELDVLHDPEPLMAIVEEQKDVIGVSPFVESELMISSATNYSGLVVRGLEIGRPMPASDFGQYLTEGSLDWLTDSREALKVRNAMAWNEGRATLDEIEELERQIAQTRQEIAHLRDQAARGLDIHGDPLPDFAGIDATLRNEDRSAAPVSPEDIATPEDPDTPVASPADRNRNAAQAAPEDPDTPVAPDEDDAPFMMPGLPPPPALVLDEATPPARPPAPPVDEDSTADAGGFVMPSLPPPATGARPSLPEADESAPGFVPLPSASGSTREEPADLPGVVIGTELQRLLNVLIGDTVNLISPDGDLGPSGPIPRSRPFRVVGVFYTGFYLFDSGMGVVHIDDARELLSVPPNEVTGIEVRVRDLNHADRVATSIEGALAASGAENVEVNDWRELNRSLFVALTLERMAMGAVLIFFIAISGLLVLLVVMMFVIEKRREIAILKAIGASRRSIMRIFLAQGVTMGIVGAGFGLLLALGFVVVAVYVGIPLDPDRYYIDRLPIEVNPWEFVLVTLSGLVVTILATLIPALQAANLDPVAGLRDDQDT